MSIIIGMMGRHLSPKTSLAAGERQMYLRASMMLRIGKTDFTVFESWRLDSSLF